MKALILTLLVTMFVGFMAQGVAAEKFPEVSYAELQAAIKDGKAVIIDVNGSQSYADAHVTNAIDFEKAGADLAKQLPADKSTLIVAYCGGPSCGAWKSAAVAAEKLGYTNVKHYKDGITGWKAAMAAEKKS